MKAANEIFPATIGKYKGSAEDLILDVETLAKSRLQVVAGSGGGKSYAIRKILEETHGIIQQIVIDPDGEYATLRSDYDYVLVGKDADVAANPRTAELLAVRILEEGVSVIIDLYELPKPDRIRFVKNFLTALVDAPKSLWHKALVILDEAHVFAPEGGKGESEALGAVRDLASRGRKRGFGLVVATQRPSKLSKDVSAECQNKLIGYLAQDVDMKRSGEDLGFTGKDYLKLRDLDPGEFYVFGPAISKVVRLAKIGKVKTDHGTAGSPNWKPTPPPDRIRKFLAKVADLPSDAEKTLTDRAELQQRIKELIRELAKAKAGVPSVDPKAVEAAREEGRKSAMDEVRLRVREAMTEFKNAMAIAMQDLGAKVLRESAVARPAPKAALARSNMPVPRPEKKSRAFVDLPKVDLDGVRFGGPERAVLLPLFLRPDRAYSYVQVALLSGYSVKSSSFEKAISALCSSGLVRRAGNKTLQVTSVAKAKEVLGDHANREPFGLKDFVNKVSGPSRAIFEVLLETRDALWDKEELAVEADYSHSSSSYEKALSNLCSLGIAVRVGGKIRLSPEADEL